MRRKNANVPRIYFISLDAVGISPILILDQNAKAKDRGSWFPSKIWMSEAAKVVHTVWCCLWVCAQLSENWQSISIKGDTILALKIFL